MNAVNLIPGDRRKRSVGVSASPITLALMAGLVVFLAAAVLYVFAVNNVRTRKSELARVTANAASWQATANSYKSYVTAAQQRTQQITDIRQLASGRFPWSLLLSQIGGVMPTDAALSSLQATSPSAAVATTTTSPATAASTSAGTSTSATAQSAVQLAGCAASQAAVAATMVALHRVQGVETVSLASSTRAGAATSSSASAGQSSGGCPFPVAFQMSLQLATASSPATSGSATATATAPPATSPGSTSAATPTASATPPSPGAAQ
jgi:hypothetical protein